MWSSELPVPTVMSWLLAPAVGLALTPGLGARARASAGALAAACAARGGAAGAAASGGSWSKLSGNCQGFARLHFPGISMSRFVLSIIILAVVAFPIVIDFVIPSALSRISVMRWRMHVHVVSACWASPSA